MLWFFNTSTVIITIYPLCKSIKKVVRGNFGILHILTVVFWAMQVLPLAVECIFGIHESIMIHYAPMYESMTDLTVGILYCIFAMTLMYSIYFIANKEIKKEERIFQLKLRSALSNAVASKWVSILLCVGMFSPCIAVIFSPRPGIYFEFSYFFMNSYTSIDVERIYHLTVVQWVNYIALGSIMLRYLLRRSGRLIENIDVLLAIILMTWFDGKRALLTFALLGLLAIDILKKRYANRPSKLMIKTLVFALVVIGYFVVYGEVTGKGDSSDFLLDYVMYYSRHSCVKVAMYDQLYTNEMLEYPGQSILYNLFFFVPRTFWEDKPVLFCKYFTPYAIGYTNGFLSWNLHVNIWTETIANFGVLGVVLSLICIKCIARSSVRSKNVLVYLFGTCFMVFYFMFGFETLTQIMYLLWICISIWTRVSRKVSFKI